jgi:2-polyprenyl-3-methyl-5-hydroxy-6-metoxy-1,4-benzoquinol methylase
VRRFRERRYVVFTQAVALEPTDTIIDVGCAGGSGLEAFNHENPITGLDLREQNRERFLAWPNTVDYVVGDALSMPFTDKQFDVAFSNSVIEHLAVDDRARYSDEIRRVASRYFVQTPNKWFPIEPHYMLPLFQFLPAPVRRHFDRKHGEEQIELLTARELAGLFPGATIHRERLLGLTKSLMVSGELIT